MAPETQFEQIAAAILAAAGANRDEAAAVASHLVRSDLAGHASHGLMRVKQYVDQIRKGEIVCGVRPTTVNDGPAFTVLDGGLGFGQVGAAYAAELACEKARSAGVAMVALRNSGHVGRLGDWAELAAARGCVSFHFVNTLAAPTVAPWGGRERRLSTNPLAWGMPVEGALPIIVDLTTSVVAEGKVRVARNAGTPVPEGWIVDRAGKSTTDPGDLYDGGALLPLGGMDAGHKGYALSLMVDLMAGALSGGGASGPARPVNCNNYTVLAIDARCIDAGSGGIAREAAAFVEWIRSATPVDSARPVLMPGEVERQSRARQLAAGFAPGAAVVASLREAAKSTGMTDAAITSLFSPLESR